MHTRCRSQSHCAIITANMTENWTRKRKQQKQTVCNIFSQLSRLHPLTIFAVQFNHNFYLLKVQIWFYWRLRAGYMHLILDERKNRKIEKYCCISFLIFLCHRVRCEWPGSVTRSGGVSAAARVLQDTRRLQHCTLQPSAWRLQLQATFISGWILEQLCPDSLQHMQQNMTCRQKL